MRFVTCHRTSTKMRTRPQKSLNLRLFSSQQNQNQSNSQRFVADGVVCLRNVVSQEWITILKKGVEKNLASPNPDFSESLQGLNQKKESQGNCRSVVMIYGLGGFFFNDYCNWQRIPEFRDFVFKSGISELAKNLMQSKTVTFYHEHVLVKDPLCLRSSSTKTNTSNLI